MSIDKRNFDKEAALWDENPTKVSLTNDIADAIISRIVLTPDMEVLDFGCGTGLLTLRLQPHIRSITGVDSSRGMLEILNAKIANQKLEKVSGLFCDLDKGDSLVGSYDLVTSSMTLHHVADTKSLLDKLYNIIVPGGYLCIADLDLDDGRFHDDNTGVFHFGFDREVLCELFVEAGFDDVQVATAVEVRKPAANGEARVFTVFMMYGRKS